MRKYWLYNKRKNAKPRKVQNERNEVKTKEMETKQRVNVEGTVSVQCRKYQPFHINPRSVFLNSAY